MKKKIITEIEIDIDKDETSCGSFCPYLSKQYTRYFYCDLFEEKLEDENGQREPLRVRKCLFGQILKDHDLLFG